LNHKRNVLFYTLFSIIGAVLILLLILTNTSEIHTIDTFDKLFIGSAFISCCIFGISLALRPNWVKRYIKRGINHVHDQPAQTAAIKRQGHHPDCEHFQSHTFPIKNNILCAGCTGLALGSIASIFLMIIYLIFFNEISKNILYIFVIAGMIFIALNYVEIAYLKRGAFVHLISNIFLVISFFFVIIGVSQLTGKVLFGILAVIISFLWLDTRIQLSNRRHTEMCKNCNETCKAY
jgi:hypothetical protein